MSRPWVRTASPRSVSNCAELGNSRLRLARSAPSKGPSTSMESVPSPCSERGAGAHAKSDSGAPLPMPHTRDGDTCGCCCRAKWPRSSPSTCSSSVSPDTSRSSSCGSSPLRAALRSTDPALSATHRPGELRLLCDSCRPCMAGVRLVWPACSTVCAPSRPNPCPVDRRRDLPASRQRADARCVVGGDTSFPNSR